MRRIVLIAAILLLPLCAVAQDCLDCHEKYQKTDHGKLKCIACHSDVKDLPHADKLAKPKCVSCHGEPVRQHEASVQAGDGRRRLALDDIAAAFGRKKKTRDVIDMNGDGRITSSEIVPFFEALEKATKGTVRIEGSIVVTDVHHDYSEVQRRDKVCATCHSNDAPFYQSMYLVLPETEGLYYMPVKGTVLAAMPSSLAVNFLLLGETKLRWSDIRVLIGTRGEARCDVVRELGFKWIDIAGVFLSLAALFLVCVHIVLRIGRKSISLDFASCVRAVQTAHAVQAASTSSPSRSRRRKIQTWLRRL